MLSNQAIEVFIFAFNVSKILDAYRGNVAVDKDLLYL